MTGKRTDWLPLPTKLRVDPSLGDAVRESAKQNFRTLQNQILYYIHEGVKRERVKSRGEKGNPLPKKERA